MESDAIVRELVASSRRRVQGATDGRVANFEGADLNGVDFRALFTAVNPGINLYLAFANFRNAKLRGANLSNCALPSADFTGADLSGANLSGAFLNDATLNDANLTDADLSRVTAVGTRVERAILTGANLKGIRGDTKFESGPVSPKKIKEAVVQSAKDAAASTELDGLTVGDAAALQEAAEDLWHHNGIPDLEAQFDDEESSDVIHGDEMWKLFQKTAVDALKARLKGGGGTKAKNVVAPKKAAKKGASGQKATHQGTPKKKPSTMKSSGRTRAR